MKYFGGGTIYFGAVFESFFPNRFISNLIILKAGTY
jgi:hypothetical protein